MQYLTTNATPTIKVTIYEDELGGYEHSNLINMTFEQMEKYYKAMNSTSREMWEDHKDIKELMRYIAEVFCIQDSQYVSVHVEFPESFINWVNIPKTDDEALEYSQDDISDVVTEREFVFADEVDDEEEIDTDRILAMYGD